MAVTLYSDYLLHLVKPKISSASSRHTETALIGRPTVGSTQSPGVLEHANRSSLQKGLETVSVAQSMGQKLKWMKIHPLFISRPHTDERNLRLQELKGD